MNHVKDSDERSKQETKLFFLYTLALIAVLAGLVVATRNVYAAEPNVLSETPFKVEGDSDEVFIIDISGSGGNALAVGKEPDIIYAFDAATRNAFICDYNAPSDGGVVNPQVGNAPAIINPFSESVAITDSQSDLDDGNYIYVADSDDDVPVNSVVPLAIELQEYLWKKCKASTSDYQNYYAFCLGVMELESTFRPSATHYNKNGSVDRGIMQINSCNVSKMKKAGLISCGDDLYDAYKCIDCGVHMLNKYIGMFGVSESAYYAYNTGRERTGSNKNSRKVMQYMAKWNATLFGDLE